MQKIHYRTLWLSDIHLGTSTSQADKVLHLLNNVQIEKLYLVGDIIDLIRMKKKFYWSHQHQEVVRKILKFAAKGVEVCYIPGNHDDRLREFVDLDIGGIVIKPYDIYKTKNNKTYLVTHGDQFDLVVTNYPMAGFLGAIGYDMLIKLNRNFNYLLRLLKLKEMSLSMTIKSKVKLACKFISNFELLLSKQAKSLNADGVICGHIHKPEVNSQDYFGIEYINCGDWVENCTFIAEDTQGNLNLIYYHQIKVQLNPDVIEKDSSTDNQLKLSTLFDAQKVEDLNSTTNKAA